MPTPTDLVTDLPADFEVFGQAVDTSMADLKGGTTGQILAKATNTDMDFTWIANDQGDITGVTATSPLTGGGTSGAITVGIQDATTSVKGSVQLSDSTSTTSSVLAATPTAVKSAYDLASTANSAAGTAQTTANAAIPKSTVTTAGDLIVANGSSSVTRLGIGANNTYLKSNGTTAAWAAVTSTSGFTLISKSAISAAAATNFDGVFTSTYTNYRFIFAGTQTANDYMYAQFRASGSTNTTANYQMYMNRWNATNSAQTNQTQINSSAGQDPALFSMDIFNPQAAIKTQFNQASQAWNATTNAEVRFYIGYFNGTTQFDGIRFGSTTGSMTGTVWIYGYGD